MKTGLYRTGVLAAICMAALTAAPRRARPQQPAPAPGPAKPAAVKVAEGQYSAVGIDPNDPEAKRILTQKMDDWTLWREPDGNYRVEATLAKPDAPAQSLTVLHLASDFHPTGYEFRAHRGRMQVSVVCTLGAAQVSCTQDSSGGVKASGETRVESPYLFSPAEELNGNDPLWELSEIVPQLPPGNAAGTLIHTVQMTGRRSQTEIGFNTSGWLRVESVAEDTLRLAGRRFSALRVSGHDEEGDLITFWTTPRGILLLVPEFHGQSRVELTAYRQFENFDTPPQ